MGLRSYLFLSKLAGFLALTVAAYCYRYSAPEPVAFKNVIEFKQFAVSKGLYFHCGNKVGIFSGNNYFIADHLIVDDDLEGICTRRDCGRTPAWCGVLWVCQIDNLGLWTTHVGGTRRIWGEVLVAGDEELMDRIEDLHRNQ